MADFGYVPKETVDAYGNPITIGVREELPPPEFTQPAAPTTYDRLLAGRQMSEDRPPPSWMDALTMSPNELKAAGKPTLLEMATRTPNELRGVPIAPRSVLAPNPATEGPAEGPRPTPPAAPQQPPSARYPAPPGTGGSGAAGAPQQPAGGEFSMRLAGGGGGGGGPRSGAQDAKAMNAAFAQQEAANRSAFDAGQQQAHVQAGFAQEAAQLAEQQAQKAVEFQRHREEAMSAQMKTFEAAQEEVAKVNTTIDPDRFWAKKGTGMRVLAAIATGMGAFGSSLTGGKNYALEIIQKAVDDDIDAQKAMADGQLKKGNAAVAASQTMFGMMRQRYDDDASAMAATQAAALGVVQRKLEASKAGMGSAEQKAKLDQLQAQVGMQRAEAMATLNQRHEENAQKWADIQTRRQNVMLDYQAKVATAKGADKKNIETVTEIEDRFRDMESARTRLESLIKTHGTAEKYEPGVEQEMNQLLNSIATDAAKLKDPSSIARSSEVQDELKNLFQPGFFQRSSSALASLRAFSSQIAERRKNAYEVRHMEIPTTQRDTEAALGATRR